MSSKTKKSVPVKKANALAIKIQDEDDLKFYVTAISAKVLYSCCYISQADEDPELGYQRLLNKGRTKQIADYLDQGNLIPGAII